MGFLDFCIVVWLLGCSTTMFLTCIEDTVFEQKMKSSIKLETPPFLIQSIHSLSGSGSGSGTSNSKPLLEL